MGKARIKALIIGCAILLAAGITAYAVNNYGSKEDPLVTKSYLDSVLQPELEKELDEQLKSALENVENTGASSDFVLVTLSDGQKVTGTVGTELLLRFGAANAYAYDAADTALVDTTDAAAVENSAALAANHLYMVTIAGNGFTATEDNTKVLICGSYKIA